ncbi:MAG: hypothetical protein DRJ65_00750 [Acidobacteria bacterium]|nr:MAG: hypothetical protein DRJ65_00750 [Acidobacteriota bacterium]
MTRQLVGRTLLAGFLLAVVACGRPRPEPMPLEILRADFFSVDNLTDLRDGHEDSENLVELWRFGQGWSRPDHKGRWAFGQSVDVQVVTLGGARRFWIECKPYHRLLQDQRVVVTLDGDEIGAFQTENSHFQWYQVDLAKPLDEGVVTLGLHFDHMRSPHEAGFGSDTRPLALKVSRLALSRDSTAFPAEEEAKPVVVTEKGLRVAQEGRLFINLWSDGPVESITFRMRPQLIDGRPLEQKEAVGVTVALRDPERDAELHRIMVFPGSPQDDLITLDAEWVRGPLQLVIETGPDLIEITDLVALAVPALTQPQLRPPPTTTPPDLIILLLDAVRADHCGATYGYHRDTTPRLDALAGEALVFRNVFAQAPYTTCSVATMFTGVAFGAHGVVRGRDRLSEQETTMAETLRDLGYRTIGVSATPNNSEGLGMAQGFDHFEQLLDGTDWLTSIDPMYAAQRIDTLVDSLDENQPLFLMAHLVPPHSPYTPPEAFRLWSEAQYDGPCDGTNSYLGGIRGPQDVSPVDLKELVALYDGNLRFCDAAVERIMADLEAKGRLENAIVVVTSDHGEAFFEHGKRSHNSTIFDEMLRVPLVVHLPKGYETEGIDLDRLASLEDLTPTLLGLVGGNSSSRTTGVDLLSGPPRSGMLLRTSESHGIFGFRSGRWKLIADEQGRFDQLYDLKADKDEQSNVILRYPGVVSAMAARWARAEKLLPPRLDVVEAGMTDEERDMLHQLGYLDSEPEVTRPEGS